MKTQIDTQGLASVNGSVPLTLLFLLWGAFGVFGIPTDTAFFAASVVTLQSLLGNRLLSVVFPNFSFSVGGLIGPGFVVGATLWVIPVQIAGSGAKLNLAVAFVLFAILIQLMRPLKLAFSWSITDEFLGVCVVAFVIMSNEWSQMIFVSLLLFMALALKNLRLLSRIQLAFSRWTLIAAAGIALIWGLHIHGPFWWIVTDDYSYYEALQIHLRSFGIWEPWGPTNISQYHWLSPAWVGQVSQITIADDWVTLTRVAPLVFSLSIAANTVELIKQVSPSHIRQSSHVLLIIGCVFLFIVLRIDFSGTSTYAVFAFSSSTILILFNCLENRHRAAGWMLFLVVTFASIFAKVFSYPMVLGITFIGLCTLLSSRRTVFFVALFAATFGSLVLYLGLLIWLGPRLGNGTEVGWSTGFGGIGTSARLLLPLAGSLIFPAIISAVIVARRRQGTPKYLFTAVAVLALLFALLTKLIVTPGFAINSDDYFLKPAKYFALLIIVFVVASTDGALVIAGSLLGLSLSLGLMRQFGAVELIISLLPQTFVATTRAELLVTQNWVLPMIVAVGGAAIFLAVKKTRNTESYITASLLAVVLMFTLQLGVDRVQKSLEMDHSEWSSRDTRTVISVLGSADLVEVGVWIAANTTPDSMIATNDLCAGDNSIYLHFLSPIKQVCESPGNDYTLGHTTKRQFLLLGPRFAYENPELRDSYMSLSLRFGATPTTNLQQELVNLGVDYFVLLNAKYPQFEMPATQTIFRSGLYSVLDLRKPLELFE